MEDRLPEELIELIFVAIANEFPLRKVLRLRLVSRSWDTRIMREQIFTRAASDYQINHCDNKATILKWLRWSYRHSRGKTLSAFRNIVKKYLTLHRQHIRSTQGTGDIDEDTVSDTLLQLFADQLISVRTQHIDFFPNHVHVGSAKKPLLWWMHRHRAHRWLSTETSFECICLCIACALGDLSLIRSLLDASHRSQRKLYPEQRLLAIPIQAAIRFGQKDVVQHLLARGTNLKPFAHWSVLDDAVRANQLEILDMLLDPGLSWFVPARWKTAISLFDKKNSTDSNDVIDTSSDTSERALRKAIRDALNSAAIVRNTNAIDRLLAYLGPAIPLVLQEDLLFATCLGNDTGHSLAEYLFSLFPALDPNFMREVSVGPFIIDRGTRCDKSPLSLAISAGDTMLVQLLLEHGAIFDYTDGSCMGHSFQQALRKGCVRCLKHNRISHHLRHDRLVQWAAQSGDVRAVQSTLGDISPRPDQQASAMRSAYRDGTRSVIALLQEHGYENEASCEIMASWPALDMEKEEKSAADTVLHHHC